MTGIQSTAAESSAAPQQTGQTPAHLSAVSERSTASATTSNSDAASTSRAGDVAESAKGATFDMSSLTPLEVHQRTQDLLQEVASERPLMSDLKPISVLRAEYEGGSQSFVKQIDYLRDKGFTGIRRTRGDGDCFYRSLAFSWIELLMNSKNKTLDVAKALSLLDATQSTLELAGFQRLVFDDFYDVLTSLIRQIIVPEPMGTVLNPKVLLEAFQDLEVSNCIVVFLRLLTSAAIRTDPETYEPFLFNPETGDDITPRDFCERYVEACGKEADHVQITALTRSLRLNIDVAYLDGHSEDGTVNFVQFQTVPPEDIPISPVLLYRPGHYDIIVHGAKDEPMTKV